MRLEYVGLRATDLRRSVAFYRRHFGLRVSHRGTMEHGGKYVLLRDARSGQRIELNWYPSDSKFNVPFVVGEGLDHVGFSVRHVQRTFDELVANGVEPAHPPWRNRKSWIAYPKDPDGNWVEIYGPG